MTPTKSQLVAALLALLIVLATAAGAYTILFPAGSGTAYTAENGLTVETATDHGLSDANPFLPDNDSIYLDGVIYSASDTTSLTATDFAAEWTNTTNVDATNASIEIAPDDRPNVTVSGNPTQFDVGNITVNDGDTDLVIDGSGTTTVTPEGLPTGTTVYAVDASGRIIAKNTTDANGAASFDISHNTTVRVDYGNGELVQTLSGTQRQISFETGVTTQTPTLSLDANTGPNVTVTGSTSVELTEPFPFSNTVNLDTTSGSAEFISNGDAAATVDASDIEGAYTNLTNVDASTNALQVDPGDKSQITIDGAATEVAFSDYALDDGVVDTVVGGPDGTSTEVSYFGIFEDGTEYTAVNQSTDTPLSVATASSGSVTFTIDHSTKNILLQEGDQSTTPTQDNAAPIGDLDQEPTDLSVDVDDADFPDDEIQTEIYLDGTLISTQNSTSAETITANIPSSGKTGGEHTWIVNTTDRFGNERIETYSYRVPDVLYTRNETNITQLVTDPVDVEVQFIADDDIYQRTTSDGTVNLTGLPVNEPLVVDVAASQNFSARTVYFETGEIYEQQAVYLLNDNFESIDTRFTLNDPTGNYGEQSVLTIRRAINDSGNLTYQTIHADKFGVEGVTATLQSDTRYKISIKNADGSLEQDLGPYRSDASETVEIQPSAPGVTFTNNYKNWGFGSEITDSDVLKWSYYDTEDETDSLTVWIHERNDPTNNLITNETYLNLGNASGQVQLTANESEQEWVVKFIVDRGDGDEIYTAQDAQQQSIFPQNLDDGWRSVVAIGLLVLLGGSFSMLNVGVGAVVFGVAGGVLWFTGWLGGIASAAAIAAYLMVAVMYYIMGGGR